MSFTNFALPHLWMELVALRQSENKDNLGPSWFSSLILVIFLLLLTIYNFFIIPHLGYADTIRDSLQFSPKIRKHSMQCSFYNNRFYTRNVKRKPFVELSLETAAQVLGQKTLLFLQNSWQKITKMVFWCDTKCCKNKSQKRI